MTFKTLFAAVLAGVFALQATPAQAAAPSLGTLWGFSFTNARLNLTTYRMYDELWLKQAQPGEVVIGRRHNVLTIKVSEAWAATYSSSAGQALTYLGEGRFLYRVPMGRMLVLNRMENGGRIAINGFSLSQSPVYTRYMHEVPPTHEINYVFGPGETVLFTMNLNEYAQACTISGSLVAPELLGGSIPAGSAGEEGDVAAK